MLASNRAVGLVDELVRDPGQTPDVEEGVVHVRYEAGAGRPERPRHGERQGGEAEAQTQVPSPGGDGQGTGSFVTRPGS